MRQWKIYRRRDASLPNDHPQCRPHPPVLPRPPARPKSPPPQTPKLPKPPPASDTSLGPDDEPQPGPGEVQIRIQGGGPNIPPQVSFHDPEVVTAHERWLPTSTERKKNLKSIQIACERCKTLHRREDLKVCSRCKTARYCSVKCQKAHWKSGHKQGCRPFGAGSPHALALKLAERTLAVPTMIDHITFLAIYTFNLLEDVSGADDHFLEISCGTRAADLQAYMSRVLAGREPDPNAQVCLSIVDIRKVEKDDERVPERVRAAAVEARAKFAPVRATGVPVATFWFTAEDPEGEDEEEKGDGDGEKGEGEGEKESKGEREVDLINAELSFQSTMDVPLRQIRYAREHPTDAVRSTVFGTTVVQRSPDMLKDNMNQIIRMDKANKLRLRAYPNGQK